MIPYIRRRTRIVTNYGERFRFASGTGDVSEAGVGFPTIFQLERKCGPFSSKMAVGRIDGNIEELRRRSHG